MHEFFKKLKERVTKEKGITGCDGYSRINSFTGFGTGSRAVS